MKNEYDLGERSLLNRKSKLQGFFKFLIDQKAIQVSPLDNIKFDRGAPYKRRPTIFSEHKIQGFIDAAKKRSPVLFYPIFLLIRETAAKRADIMTLHWKDINFNTNILTFARSTELQTRSFEISHELRHALLKIDRISDYVFTSVENQPFKVYNIGRELKVFQRMSGFETTWSLRDLRFSYGINFLKRGGAFTELQRVMGHKTRYNTEEVYGRYERLILSHSADSTAVQETGIVS